MVEKCKKVESWLSFGWEKMMEGEGILERWILDLGLENDVRMKGCVWNHKEKGIFILGAKIWVWNPSFAELARKVAMEVAVGGGDLLGSKHHCPVDMRKVGAKVAAGGGDLFGSEHHCPLSQK